MTLLHRPALMVACLALLPGTAQEPAFRNLLDGDRLEAWDPAVATSPRVALESGSLVVTGPSGWLVTRERHSDVVLRFEAKADPGTAGGVLVRALTEPDRMRAAYHILVADGEGRAGGLQHIVKDESSNPVPGPPTSVTLPAEWHSYRIECRAGTLKAWIGARQVLNVGGLVQNVGRIGFLVSQGRLSIRRLQMQEHEPVEPEPPPGVLRVTADGVTTPVARSQVRPHYTARALAAKTQGDVWIAVVIRPDGKVDAPRVYRSLAPDLDQEAIDAVRRWRFTPARKDNAAVAAQATISMSFSMK
jgi:TonB family protein